jgi:sigma-B regulation protein RsbU (phosphoserine phosphatase)
MKILTVDDEYVSRKKLEMAVQSLGYETLTASHGVEGLNVWEHEKPRIVITDWLMPGIDGIELCKKIREAEKGQYTYIIMLTIKKGIQSVIDGIDAGADDFISKPFQKEELAARIKAGERILEIEGKLLTAFNDLTEEIEERKRTEEELAKQRDYLMGTIHELKQAKKTKRELISKLRNALSAVNQLSGLLPICSHCKKIRDDKGYWKNLEEYIAHRSGAQFSHSVCPKCMNKYYPEVAEKTMQTGD